MRSVHGTRGYDRMMAYYQRGVCVRAAGVCMRVRSRERQEGSSLNLDCHTVWLTGRCGTRDRRERQLGQRRAGVKAAGFEGGCKEVDGK